MTAEASERPRFQSERQEEITSLLSEAGRVEVSELAERFDVTTETIRRDLAVLADQQVLRRVHGGAVAYHRARHEPTLAVRETQYSSEKRKIARRAIEELPPDGSVIIDSGSTLAVLADTIPPDQRLTVFTNSIPVVGALADHDEVQLHVIGGQLRTNTMAMVDETGAEAIGNLTVDVLFISTDGVSEERAFTTPYKGEVAIKRAMIAAARRVVLLVDHHKLGTDRLFRFAEFAEIDTLITDDGMPASVANRLQALGPQVVRAE